MPRDVWNLGQPSEEFVEVKGDTVHYNPLQAMFDARRRQLVSEAVDEITSDWGKSVRQKFLDSLSPSERKVFDEVAYPKGFRRLRHVTVDDLMKRQYRKMSFINADSPQFLEQIRRNL